ncbi:pentapeptide repeat-containing protein [Roseibium sp.]|uniref:pentapeptide repeat-containing protein n=1 Tax=Roseibium sp. TaxID=1936156 RepID=UPI003BB08D95
MGDGRAEKIEPLTAADKSMLKHVDVVSTNARGTWFVLTATLLFSAIAVAGVRDRDFFAYGSGLTLPLINFSVPINSFFLAAPVIVLGLYIYLHLYLGKLWRALYLLGPKLRDSRSTDDVVFPWLISDAAIYLLPDAPQNARNWLTIAIVFLVLWLAGPVVLGIFWWRSFAPHNVWLTLWTGGIFGLGLLSATVSFLSFLQLTRSRAQAGVKSFWKFAFGFWVAFVLVVCVLITAIGVFRTAGFNLIVEKGNSPSSSVDQKILAFFNIDEQAIYSANLYKAEIVQRPQDWIDHDEAEARFLAQYSGIERRLITGDEDWVVDAKKAFDNEQKARRDGLKSQPFEGWNLRGANAQEAFMPGAEMRKADLRGANFLSAVLEGATLFQANLEHARFRFANLQTARLWKADMDYTCLEKAKLVRADLSCSFIRFGEMRKVNLSEVYAVEANLIGANLEKAELRKGDFNKANFADANLEKADLWGATLVDADLQGAILDGALVASADLSSKNLSEKQLMASFGDGATNLPDGFLPPPHWPTTKLDRASAEREWRNWRKERSDNEPNAEQSSRADAGRCNSNERRFRADQMLQLLERKTYVQAKGGLEPQCNVSEGPEEKN